MKNWVVYYDNKHIYFTDRIEKAPLYIPWNIEEAFFNSKKEMMDFVEKLENRG